VNTDGNHGWRARSVVMALGSTIGALFALAALFLASTATASADIGLPDAVSPDIAQVEEYQKDFPGTSLEQAKDNLEKQALGVGVVELLKSTLGESYAGVWFDNSAGEFVIPKLDGVGSAHVQRLLAATGLGSEFRIEPARSSWTELEAGQAELNKHLGELANEQMQTGLDPRTNAVVVRVAAGAKALEALLANEAKKAPVDVEVKRAPGVSLGTQNLSCLPAVRACGRPLRGGVGIGSNLGPFKGPTCTAAFKALGNQFGNRFILTAGHCASPGQPFAAEDFDSATYKPIGVAEESNPTPGDWAKIKANGSFWDTASWPSTMAYWGTNELYPIEGESASFVGQYVCHSGLATFYACGSVVYLNVTDENDGQEHLTMFGPTCAGEGDSGGPVIQAGSHTALGIFSGRVLPPPPCGQEYAVYAEVTEAADAMGVTVGPRLGTKPYAGTESVSGADSVSATLNGVVAPHALATSYHFIWAPQETWATGETYSHITPSVSLGSGWGKAGVSAPVTEELLPHTVYHYRVVAENAAGIVWGGDEEFETPDWRPVLMSQSTSHRTSHGAILEASINPTGFDTRYVFEYGKTTSYGLKVPMTGLSIGSGMTPIAVSKEVPLNDETTYHYRVTTWSSQGFGSRPDGTFTTAASALSFQSSFGALGVNPGGFSSPTGMEADPVGNVWIADRLNNRVKKYDEQGNLKRVVGSKGTAPGLLSEPRDVALDSEGNVWVADMGNARIQEYNASGQFIRQIGGAGELNGFGEPYIGKPFGIAVGREGHIFVTDQKWNNVQEYRSTPDGSGHYFLAQWSVVGGVGLQTPSGMSTDAESNIWFVTSGDSRVYEIPASGGAPIGRFGVTGSGFGQTLEPSAIAIKPSGNVLIADRGNNRVVQFSPQGEQLGSFGIPGTGPGQFERPAGIALAANGLVFVADTGNNRIERWAQPASPNADTQSATSVTGKGAILNGVVNPNSRTTTYSFEYGPTTAYGSSVPIVAASVGSGIERVAVSQTLALPAEATYHYRIAASNEAGTTFGKDAQFKTTPVSQYQSAFGATGSESGQFSHPADTAIDSKGNLWVVDKGNNRIEQFSEKGEFLKAVGSIGVGGGKLTSPSGLVIDASGNIWVSDTSNNRVEQFNEKGEFVSTFGKEVNKSRVEAGGTEAEKNRCTASSGNVCQAGKAGSANGQFKGPKGIAATAGGNLMVVDAGNSRVQKIGPSGEYLAKIGSTSAGIEQLKEPASVAVAADGSIWVADAGNNRLAQWTSTFEWIRQVGSAGTGNGQFNRPDAVEVGGDGKLWVGDEGGDRIEVFNSKGEYLRQFGATGTGVGQFKLTDPMGVAIGAKGFIWVTDTDNNRIQKWTLE
jgi:tripartite motif-containing protein 71